MTNHRRILVIAGMLCLGLWGLACDHGNAPYDSKTGTVNANKAGTATQLTDSDKAFAIKAATGGKHEVELGRMAATQASNSEVKAFANRMVQDHSRAGDELMQLTSRLGISLPAEEDITFKQMFDRLSKLKGADFDRAYMNEMVEDHKKDADEISTYASSGTNSDLKAWASKMLPTVREHLQLAQDLEQKVGGPMKIK